MDGRTLVDLGAQRFDKIRGRKSLYIDKTGFIKEWWEYGSDVTLITRPRRFGKTLNLSMTECFFSNRYADRGDLFQGLSIWEEEKYRKLQGTFPVIFISFANIKAAKYEDMAYAVTEVIAELYEQNKLECVGRLREKEYTLALTNMEVESMFKNMVKDWFGGETAACYNEFICALLNDNVRKMNTFMNRVALETFSAFDSGSKPSKQAQPERFYHGFVLGMVVNLSDRY